MQPPHLVLLKCCIFIDVLPTSRCPASPLCCSCWVADAPAAAKEVMATREPHQATHAAVMSRREHIVSQSRDKR